MVIKKKKIEDELLLTATRLVGFKSILDLSVNFQPGLNLLIGKNASGKSNLLECLAQCINQKSKNTQYKFAQLEFTNKSSKFVWQSEREMNPVANEKNDLQRIHYKENLKRDGKTLYDNSSSEKYKVKPKRVYPGNHMRAVMVNSGLNFRTPLIVRFNLPEELDFIEKSGTVTITTAENGLSYWPIFETLNFMNSLMYSAEIYFDDNIKELRNLTKTNFIKQLTIQEKIKQNLHKYSPIQDLRFNPNLNIYKVENTITVDNVKLEFKVNNNWLPWTHLSDGTKRLFYLITEISHRNAGMVLLEEPELGIHPHQFHLIMEFLKNESIEKQIILSTHSPQALNCLREDELSKILILKYEVKKGTTAKNLTNIQIRKAKKYMNEVGFLSDYWMLSDLES